ncbi:MAG: F0F1 ATP synthase subunit gamma [Acidobacteriota bacterium]|nr:F0F1 ATP synthase subunit gamma [Acidobacteriota bacterium]
MESLERLAGTLSSLEDLQSIVRTMKALSAVSIRQYERAVRSLASYNRTVDLGLRVVLRDMPSARRRSRDHRDAPAGVVIVGSDHGLCGRFNEELAAFLLEHVRSRGPLGARVLAIGSRLPPLLEEASVRVDAALVAPGSAPGIATTVNRLLVRIDAWVADDGVASVHVLYQRRRSGARGHPVAQRLLPIDLHRFHRLEQEPWPSPVLPTFGMGREQLFAALARQHLFVTLFRACAESQAAEHASRLSAMEAAERNLDERRAELLGMFRRQRQEAITAELLDVVSGYEALAAGPSVADSTIENPRPDT